MAGSRVRDIIQPRPARRRPWRVAAGIAGVAGLLACGLFEPEPGDPDARILDLEIVKAPYPPVDPVYRDDAVLWRGGSSGGMAVPDGFDEGMAAYPANDLEEARQRLSGCVRQPPTHELSRFHLGVTLLLLDRDDEAVFHLRRSALRHRDASWYFLRALLRTGRRIHAVEILRARSSWGEDPHREEAEALLRRLGAPAP